MAKKNLQNLQTENAQDAVQKVKAPKITVSSEWVRKDNPDLRVSVEDVSNKFVWFRAGAAGITEKLEKPAFRDQYDKIEREKSTKSASGTRAARGEKDRILTAAHEYIMAKVKEGLDLTAFRKNDNYIHARTAEGSFEAWANGSGLRVTMDPAREDFADLVEANEGQDLGEPNYRKGKTIVFFPEANVNAIIDALLSK